MVLGKENMLFCLMLFTQIGCPDKRSHFPNISKPAAITVIWTDTIPRQLQELNNTPCSASCILQMFRLNVRKFAWIFTTDHLQLTYNKLPFMTWTARTAFKICNFRKTIWPLPAPVYLHIVFKWPWESSSTDPFVKTFHCLPLLVTE